MYKRQGYGLHIESLQKLIPKYDLLITVDCGITALDEVDYAKDKIDMIITDHHLPREILPDAFAIINPTQTQDVYKRQVLEHLKTEKLSSQSFYR